MNRLVHLLLTLYLSLMAFGTQAQSHAIDAAEASAIRATIESQLAALAEDDATRAFGFASEDIQERFGSPQNFMEMVKRYYPAVYRPASAVFLAPELTGDEIIQVVRLTDTQGQLWMAVYRMQRQRDNTWRIGGCVVQGVEGSST